MFVSEDLLVTNSSGRQSFRLAIEQFNNLITTLRPYIQGRVSLKVPSASPVKLAPKKISIHSRQPKTKVAKLSELESSSSTDDEEARTTSRTKIHLVFFPLTRIKLEER